MASALSFVPWDPNRGEFDPDKAKWELYNIDEDFSQANDLAAKQIRRSCASCRTCGGWRRRSTTSCRSTGAASIRHERRSDGPAEPDRAAAPSIDLLSRHGRRCPTRRRRRCSTSRGRSRRTSKCPTARPNGMIVTARRPRGRLRPLPARWQADVRLQLPRRRSPHVRGEGSAAERQDEARRRLRLRRRRHGQGRHRHHDRQRQEDRRRAAGEDHPDPVLARRRTRHRHGQSARRWTSPTSCRSRSRARSRR